MTNAGLIVDEGFCSVSQRNNGSWNRMDYSNNFDYSANGQLGDPNDPYFALPNEQMLNAIEQSLLTNSENPFLDYAVDPTLLGAVEPQQTLWRPLPQSATVHSRPNSQASSLAASAASSHDQMSVDCNGQQQQQQQLHSSARPNSHNIFATHSTKQAQTATNAGNMWYECGAPQAELLSSPIAAALPPLHSTMGCSGSSTFKQEQQDCLPVATTQYVWSNACQPGPSGLQPCAAGPSGVQFMLPQDSNTTIINSPNASYGSERISSPGSTLSGTAAMALQQLSPTDERRLRNNEASRRSRQNQKTKNEELQIKLYQLELENLSLKKNIDEVTKMVKYMKEKLVEYMQSKS